MKFLIILITLPLFTLSQNCSCEESFNWMKKTFEENDAGFQYVIDSKGVNEYQKHNEIFSQKVKLITKKEECSAALFEWLLFFRKAHLGIKLNNPTEQVSVPITTNHDDWEKSTMTEEKLKKHLSKITEPTLEGIWVSGQYTIGISKEKNEYIGFIIDEGTSNWKKNQIKLRIKQDTLGKYDVSYYMGDFSERKFNSVVFTGNNTVAFGFISLERKFPLFKDDPEIVQHRELMNAQEPIGMKISENTFLLRIPSFNDGQKKKIDSILDKYHDQIVSTENLIIDIRNNGGGSDGSYQKLIPYLYTNPIRGIGVEYLSTPLNNKRMEGFLSENGLSKEEKEELNDYLTTLNSNLGKFVSLNKSSVDTLMLDTIYAYPKNVSIVINENCASTSEQFLLEAKQSKKVKLFGTTTYGILDISNMYFVDFPCKDFTLGYSLTKSLRIPEMTVDGKGIQPDFYIDKFIPEYQWIDYVQKMTEAK